MWSEPDVGYCNDLVRQVREDADLKLDAVARATHFSRSAISRYELGEVAVPYDYAARLYEQTSDLRLVQFFDQRISDAMFAPCNTIRIPPHGTAMDELRRQHGLLQVQLDRVRILCEVLKDGKVGPEESQVITAYMAKGNDLIKGTLNSNRALMALMQQAEAKS